MADRKGFTLGFKDVVRAERRCRTPGHRTARSSCHEGSFGSARGSHQSIKGLVFLKKTATATSAASHFAAAFAQRFCTVSSAISPYSAYGRRSPCAVEQDGAEFIGLREVPACRACRPRCEGLYKGARRGAQGFPGVSDPSKNRSRLTFSLRRIGSLLSSAVQNSPRLEQRA